MSTIANITINKTVSYQEKLEIQKIDKCVIDCINTNDDSAILLINSELVDSYKLLHEDIEHIIGAYDYHLVNY